MKERIQKVMQDRIKRVIGLFHLILRKGKVRGRKRFSKGHLKIGQGREFGEYKNYELLK